MERQNSRRLAFMENMLFPNEEDDNLAAKSGPGGVESSPMKNAEDQSRRDDEVQQPQSDDAEDGTQPKKKSLPYPKAIPFIIGNEFCERFSFYGLRAILTLYITEKLGYTEDAATGIFHVFVALAYFMPLLGAIIADSWLGKFSTIWIVSLVYILGLAFQTLATVTPLGLPPQEFSFIGLTLIAVGTGGIKPCVSAFGGDQFQLPEQERQLQTFFSIFYFTINAGSLISTLVTPILRQDVHCLGEDSCYPLAFGLPAVLMAIATVILVLGKPLYVIKAPKGNIITSVMGAIWTGLGGKIRSWMGRATKRNHWLDHAKGVYSDTLVNDTKKLLHVLKIFLPIPVFWALFDQQSSRWTFQAVRTSGQVSTHIIKPDQVQVLNPLLILTLIPVFDRIVYPLFAKIGLFKDPIQRIFVGGMLAALAFFMSGGLELTLQPTYGIVPKPQESHVHIMNSMDCLMNVRVQLPRRQRQDTDDEDIHHHLIESKASYIIQGLSPGQNYTVTVKSVDQEPSKCRDLEPKQFSFNGVGGETTEYFIDDEDIDGGSHQIRAVRVGGKAQPSNKRSSHSNPSIRVVLAYNNNGESLTGNDTEDVLLYGIDNRDTIQFRNLTTASSSKDDDKEQLEEGAAVTTTEYKTVFPQAYRLLVNHVAVAAAEGEKNDDQLVLRQGGVYTVVVHGRRGQNGVETTLHMDRFVLTPENSVHMLWLIPQYVVITCGEVMLSITGLEFSYSQAPASMKSLVQACWLLTAAVGNLIVAFVAEAHLFEAQAAEFFLFGSLMVVVMIWLWFLAKGSGCCSRRPKTSVDSTTTNQAFLIDY